MKRLKDARAKETHKQRMNRLSRLSAARKNLLTLVPGSIAYQTEAHFIKNEGFEPEFTDVDREAMAAAAIAKRHEMREKFRRMHQEALAADAAREAAADAARVRIAHESFRASIPEKERMEVDKKVKNAIAAAKRREKRRATKTADKAFIAEEVHSYGGNYEYKSRKKFTNKNNLDVKPAAK